MIIIKERRKASVVALWTLCADHDSTLPRKEIFLCLALFFFFPGKEVIGKILN